MRVERIPVKQSYVHLV
ncbi:unnamed protein product [Staurois parvus]|uniref:Uncharacterized protein n=1 Tax=Staurois parvus TaxID=386267 RepID=A0ABN9HLA9_9NEOB|nr:unnamed protein product [Staurois parvus]